MLSNTDDDFGSMRPDGNNSASALMVAFDLHLIRFGDQMWRTSNFAGTILCNWSRELACASCHVLVRLISSNTLPYDTAIT